MEMAPGSFSWSFSEPIGKLGLCLVNSVSLQWTQEHSEEEKCQRKSPPWPVPYFQGLTQKTGDSQRLGMKKQRDFG